MNEVIDEVGLEERIVNEGSIWKNPETGDCYILGKIYSTRVGVTWAAFNLANGWGWKSEPMVYGPHAVDGLTLVAEQVEIRLSRKE
jgi:hypothetical protein